MFTRYLLLSIVFIATETAFGNENAAYDHEVETMWADIARGFSPLEVIKQSVGRTAPFEKRGHLSGYRLQLERHRILHESLPEYFRSDRPTFTSVLVWVQGATKFPLDQCLINASDMIFGYLLNQSDEPFFVARTLEEEVQALERYFVAQYPKENIESAKKRYQSALLSSSVENSTFFAVNFLPIILSRPNKSGSTVAKGRYLELAEEILGLNSEKAIQSYANLLSSDLNGEDTNLLRNRIRFHLQADSALRHHYQRFGSVWNRLRAKISNSGAFKCSVLLGQLARKVENSIAPNRLPKIGPLR